MTATIHLGKIRLAGYAGVTQASPPSVRTMYGFVMPRSRQELRLSPVHWSWAKRPNDDAVFYLGLDPDQAPKYRVTVYVPHMMWGTLAEKMADLESRCEELRRQYRAQA